MWVADTFRWQAALRDYADRGIFGYFGDDRDYLRAIGWWMDRRHGWTVDPDWVFTTHGLVNGTALCIDTWTAPGDGVVLFTPVYHCFARVIRDAGRRVVECEMPIVDGRYVLDIEAWDAQMTGDETLLVFCSPHNPGGRVWTDDELHAVAQFADRHGLILVSDEIHHDLVMPGHRHRIFHAAVPGIEERLVMMSASTKTFNIAGAHVGNVIIPDARLRAQFGARMAALGMSPNAFGIHMATAAYSPEGAIWVDALIGYLDGNRRLFDEAINALPGLRSMPLESTYLAWVDFSGTGMATDEFTARVERDARIAVNRGPVFGRGGERFLRFNLATPRLRVAEAANRLQDAFADLQ
jgi:cystathionine beta-lyase